MLSSTISIEKRKKIKINHTFLHIPRIKITSFKINRVWEECLCIYFIKCPETTIKNKSSIVYTFFIHKPRPLTYIFRVIKSFSICVLIRRIIICLYYLINY